MTLARPPFIAGLGLALMTLPDGAAYVGGFALFGVAIILD